MRMPKSWSLLLLLIPMGLLGQSVDATLGGSQIIGVAGVQTNYVYRGIFGWTGVGYYNGGFQVSSYLNLPLRFAPATKANRDRYRLGVGDQELNTRLITDEYASSQSIVRGASIYRHTKISDIQAFVGNFSAEDRQPYFHAISKVNSNLTGAVIGHLTINKRMELESFNTFGDSITSIQSLGWMRTPNLHITTAGGIGSNRPYFANAAEYRKGGLDLRASYTVASEQFRRQDSGYSIESLGFNAKAEVPLGRNTMAQVSHRRELIVVPQYLGYQQNSSIGTTDSASISTRLLGFRASASVNESSSNSYVGKNISEVFSISRKILPRWQSTFSYLHNSMQLQDIAVIQNTSEFRVNNHLALSHNVSRINGSITNTFGGRWSSNLVSFSVDNQVYTSPVAAQFGQKSVFQAWNFSIRFRTPHGTTVNLATTVDPTGKTQWGGYLSGLQYQSLNSYSQKETYVNFSKYVVHGKVVNEAGDGVWGIAVQVGPEMVHSGTEGDFFIHVKNPKPMPLQVVADASLQSGWWQLQSAPTVAQGTPEGAPGSPLMVVVQMTRPPYVVQGKVIDEAGHGVWGIAVQIGQETVISNAEGAFFTHVKDNKAQPFLVVKEASPQLAKWNLQSAPATAQGVLESDTSNPLWIVVHRDTRVLASN